MADENYSQKIEELQKAGRPCFQCGICASSCPVFRVAPEMNPRLAVDSVVSKGDVPVEGNEWLCSYCLMCEERCPMGVSLAEILIGIKNISSRKGHAPKDFVESGEALLAKGCLSPQSNRSDKKRVELGLPDLPQPNLEQVKLIFEATGAYEVLKANRAVLEEEAE
ncbi:MAG: 4Fe-4S dicluster domain-containing protein [Candidatus Thorarchaeota archaeon]